MTTELIVDSSVAVKWLTKEVFDDEANDVLARWVLEEYSVLAPDILFAEVGNILWKKHRQGIMSREHIARGLERFLNFPFEIVTASEIIEPTMKIAIAYDRTFYDSLYLALAEDRNCRFVTADDRLANAVAAHFPNVIKLSDWKPSPPTTTTAP